MRDRTKVLLHAVAFFLLFSYGYPYLKSYIHIENPEIFQFIDNLTGYPPFINRIVSFFYVLALYIFFALILEREPWKDAFFAQDTLKGLLKGGGFALIIAIGLLAAWLLTGFQVLNGFSAKMESIIALVFAWTVVQIFNATKEELLFRGYLLRRLAAKFNKHLCILATSLVFGLGHIWQYHMVGFLFAAIFGITAGYIYLFYGNIYVPIGMHAVWDVLSHTVLAGRIVGFQPGPLQDWLGPNAFSVYAPVYYLAAFVLFLIVFFVRKRLWRL